MQTGSAKVSEHPYIPLRQKETTARIAFFALLLILAAGLLLRYGQKMPAIVQAITAIVGLIGLLGIYYSMLNADGVAATGEEGIEWRSRGRRTSLRWDSVQRMDVERIEEAQFLMYSYRLELLGEDQRARIRVSSASQQGFYEIVREAASRLPEHTRNYSTQELLQMILAPSFDEAAGPQGLLFGISKYKNLVLYWGGAVILAVAVWLGVLR
ncbi:MAG: hypothetical protein HYY08_02345 [Firmicutes bacterium]|nr:hypothetical protein [Bacillota bacterium]